MRSKQVAMGDQGFLGALKDDAVWLEMSTIDPDASVAFADRSKELGKNRLEVPIVGNPDMEAQRKVMLLVGGDKGTFWTVRGLSKGAQRHCPLHGCRRFRP